MGTDFRTLPCTDFRDPLRTWETQKLLCPSKRLRKRGEDGGQRSPGPSGQVPECPRGPEVSHTGEEAVGVQRVSLKGKRSSQGETESAPQTHNS